MTRIDDTFARLKADGKKAFVTFTMAGDPNYETSLEVMKGLPAAGADVIELGMPFTDPMADGPTIQLAGQRALDVGMTLEKTLEMVRAFRVEDKTTPIVFMGYYNPIYHMGVSALMTSGCRRFWRTHQGLSITWRLRGLPVLRLRMHRMWPRMWRGSRRPLACRLWWVSGSRRLRTRGRLQVLRMGLLWGLRLWI